MLIAFSGLLIVLAYAVLAMLFGITKFQPNENWPNSLGDIVKVGIPVAISEELIFRVAVFQVVFMRLFHLDIFISMVLTSLIFAGCHFWLGMYKKAIHQVELFIGLFLFSMILCKLVVMQPAIIAWGVSIGILNILWHAGSIYGVQLTNSLFTKEEDSKWDLWDESHAVIRCFPLWIILVILYLCI